MSMINPLFMSRSQASLDPKLHLQRFRIVQTFMLSGTPLQRMRHFRPLFEWLGASLTDHSHMAATYIPKIEEREFSLLRQELANGYIGLSFDGTSRLGEAINIVGRMCSEKFELQTRLLRFVTSKLHLKASQFCALIGRVICTELRLQPDNIVCISRDSVLVNGAACQLLKDSIFHCADVQLCISHTLNNVGSRIDFELLSRFMTPWLELVGGRNPHRGARALWRSAVSPEQVPGYSAVRWHALAEIQFVLARNFDKIAGFFQSLDEHGYGDATRKRLHELFDPAQSRYTIKLQLAAMLDMQVLVKTTYELEGDRLELMLVYDRIERLRKLGEAIQNGGDGVLPNVDAVIRSGMTLKNGVQIGKVSSWTC